MRISSCGLSNAADGWKEFTFNKRILQIFSRVQGLASENYHRDPNRKNNSRQSDRQNNITKIK